jgi:hypothetical protein
MGLGKRRAKEALTVVRQSFPNGLMARQKERRTGIKIQSHRDVDIQSPESGIKMTCAHSSRAQTSLEKSTTVTLIVVHPYL